VTSLNQFFKIHHAITSFDETHLLFKNNRMNRFKEWVCFGGNLVVPENLKPTLKPKTRFKLIAVHTLDKTVCEAVELESDSYFRETIHSETSELRIPGSALIG
jgi:hypothetical protein